MFVFYFFSVSFILVVFGGFELFKSSFGGVCFERFSLEFFWWFYSDVLCFSRQLVQVLSGTSAVSICF